MNLISVVHLEVVDYATGLQLQQRQQMEKSQLKIVAPTICAQ